jgi:hypothetical protein
MNFKQFLERDDLHNIQQFHNDAQQVFTNLVSYYESFWDAHFPKKIRGQDDHDYIMNLRQTSEKWNRTVPQIYGHKVYILPVPQSGHWSSFIGDIKGEIVGKSIRIYSSIYNLLQDAKFWSDSYIYNLIGHKPNKAIKAKKEAKKPYAEFLIQLKQQKEPIIETLFHEIIHASRHDHIKNPTIPLRLATKAHIFKTYTNNPPELDAHFLQKAFQILKTKQPYKSFNEFLIKFKELIGEPHFNFLIQKNQRKMISRLYQLYNQIQKHV